jgi:hypothetical protein
LNSIIVNYFSFFRFREILLEQIDNGNCTAYSAFVNEKKSKIKKRKVYFTKEAEEAEKMKKEIGMDDSEESLRRMIEANSKKREGAFDFIADKYTKQDKEKQASKTVRGRGARAKATKLNNDEDLMMQSEDSVENDNESKQSVNKRGDTRKKAQTKAAINDDQDSFEEEKVIAAPKKRGGPRKKAEEKKEVVLDEAVYSSEEFVEKEQNSEDEVKPQKKRGGPRKKAEEKKEIIPDERSNTSEEFVEKEQQGSDDEAVKPKKKRGPPKKKVVDESNSEDSADKDKIEPAKKRGAPKKKTTAK